MRPGILLVWLGALLVIGGIVQMAAQPLWRGRLSDAGASSATGADSLEPPRPTRGFGLRSNWPGIALIVVGAILLLGSGAF